MTRAIQIAIFVIAACALSTGVFGQKVYRCGSSYSQIPCANGVAIDAQDPRSKAQKSQAETVIKNDAATAKAMEKERIQHETQTQSAGKAPHSPVTKKTSALATSEAVAKSVPESSRIEVGKPKTTSTKKKEAEYFTAQGAAEKTKKPASAPQ